MAMIRTQIYLTQMQHRLIQKLARQQRSSAAEIIRQAVESYLEKMVPGGGEDPLFKIIGLGASGETKGSIEHDKGIYDAN